GCMLYDVCFFFQAEDGIRDYKVTGVQTCALPISGGVRRLALVGLRRRDRRPSRRRVLLLARRARETRGVDRHVRGLRPRSRGFRSEERRVGKKCRIWWSADE